MAQRRSSSTGFIIIVASAIISSVVVAATEIVSASNMKLTALTVLTVAISSGRVTSITAPSAVDSRSVTEQSATPVHLNGVMAKPTLTTTASGAQDASPPEEPILGTRSKGPPHIALPCRLMSSSGFRVNASSSQLQPAQYALSNSSIWVHHPVSGDWTELRSTLIPVFDPSWSVKCVLDDDETNGRETVVIANRTAALAYHRASAKWIDLSTPETIRDEAKVVWCQQGVIHVYSTNSGQLLTSDPLGDQMNTSHVPSLPPTFTTGDHTKMIYWYLSASKHIYVMLERPVNGSTTCNCSVVARASTYSEFGSWTLLDKWEYSDIEGGSHPSPHSGEAPVTWTDGSNMLWMWRPRTAPKVSADGHLLWSYNILGRSWQRRKVQSFGGEGAPRLPLLGWATSSQSCIIFAPATCREPFTLTKPVCIEVSPATNRSALRKNATQSKSAKNSSKNRVTRKPGSKVVLFSTVKPRQSLDAAPTIPITTSASTSTIATVNTSSNPSEDVTTPISVTTEDIADEEMDGDELDLELGSPWHDSESGIFDSVIFCATSAVALCLVSAIWCVRHCAPFPKEALLPLRDPPSVRYTAIPDHTIA
ncbi:uncharacterized protein LOC114828030 [Galendromus occidentalis]|uniref:Uncharacterized protein LOC114828030 n=1 Tax=Galendromus occidentalis TaxID=34638 RepID=A0AAJ7WGX4_9ACAR|nr:uncharacterized protein LOC114828030 [Galendromus occidentalis]